MAKNNKLLTEKYHQIKENFYGMYTGSDATGGAAGGWNGSGEAAIDEEGENVINKDLPDVALDAQIVGLFEPRNEEETKQTNLALKDLDEVLHKITKEIETWQHKHIKLGACDTVAKDQLAQYIAKSVFGITKLD